jgi:hypothetical protein
MTQEKLENEKRRKLIKDGIYWALNNIKNNVASLNIPQLLKSDSMYHFTITMQEILELHMEIEKAWFVEQAINDDDFFDITASLNRMSDEIINRFI